MPGPSSDLPESGPGRSLLSIWSCSGWGLHSPSRYRDGGSLLHCHSTLTPEYCFAKLQRIALQSSEHIALQSPGRYYFCCTGLGVASTGCYPASCPVKPGLSSPVPFRLYSRDHLFYLPITARTAAARRSRLSYIAACHLHFKTAPAHKLPAKGIFRQFLAADPQEILQELKQPFRLMVSGLALLNPEKQRLRILFEN